MDEQRFTALFNQHWKKLFGFCCYHVQDTEQAREMVQDIFCSLWERRERQKINTEIANYLFGAARLKIANYFRDKYSRQEHLKHIAAFQSETTYDTEEAILYENLDGVVNSLVSSLPEKCREVYTLSRKKELTIPEIAGHLNIAEKTVEAHLSKALKFLRSRLRTSNS